jgi:hypothetical protein
MEKNRNNYDYQKLRGIIRKLHLIDLRGGSCEKCGYCENLSAIDFHHKDPNEKEGGLDIRKLSNSSMEWVLREFDKCLVLCSNCHREYHSPDLIIENIRLMVNDDVLKIRTINKPKCVDCGKKLDYGVNRCKPCFSIKRRKVERPDINTLKNEVELLGYVKTGKKYGVSDNAIRKWIKYHQKS